MLLPKKFVHGELNAGLKHIFKLPGSCNLKLALSACRFNLLFDPPTTAGLLGDTDDATDVPPDDFRDSLEALTVTKIKIRKLKFSKGSR